MHSSCIQSIPFAIIIALLLSTACKINAVPLSWRGGHFKRSSSIDDLPTQAGTLSDRLSEGSRSPAGGGSPTSTPTFTPSTPPPNFPCSCKEDTPPESRIQELRQRFIDFGPHPMFYVSEVAEMIHRQVYYQEKNGNCNNWTTSSVLELTINRVKQQISSYLNNGLPTKGQVLCPPKYNVTYYGPGRYPFYQVEVICMRDVSESASTNPCSCDSSHRRRCAAYRLNYMRHLERVPATMSSLNSTQEEWREIITDVGVGCKCDST